jgi:hypothetical protein
VQKQADTIHSLKDEIQRLKGEQPTPKFPPKRSPKNLSSSKEHQLKKARHKAKKQANLILNRTEILTFPKEQLPPDAIFKGYEQTIIQEVVFLTEAVCYKRKKYYSPSLKFCYTAPLPQGYEGQFGPGVRAWVLDLYYGCGMSEPKIYEFLHTIGLVVSRGQISNWLIKDHQLFHAEGEAIVRADLDSSEWQNLDSTATHLNGKL